MADRDDIIRKVQSLWQRADHPNTPEAERQSCIAKAQELMAKYTIDEMVLQESSGKQDAIILSDIRITTEGDSLAYVDDQRILLGHFIALHNRCQTVIRVQGSSIDGKTGEPVKGGTFLTVVGYQSDVDMVKDLYVALGMDMLTGMFAEKVDHVPARERKAKFASFCDGYAMRIGERLAAIATRVQTMAVEHDHDSGTSMALVLRSKEVAVRDTFADMFPNLKVQKIKTFKYDANYAERGRQAANKADLGQTKVGGGSRGELGS